MKFYIIDDDSEMRALDGGYTKIFSKAKQYSFKEAREICEGYNGGVLGVGVCYKAMIPAPKEDVKKVEPKPEDKYLILYGNEYYLEPGAGRTTHKEDAFHYPYTKAEYICRGDNDLSMEKVDETDS